MRRNRRRASASMTRRALLGGLLPIVHSLLPSSCVASKAGRPNIVLIVTDDMRATDFQALPLVKRLLADQGVTFPNFFVTTPLCCPSRSSILRGQYAHNHGVLGNSGQTGGWGAFHQRGNDENTLASWLSASGYRTALIGKYLNGYDHTRGHVPPGWSRWFVSAELSYYNYTLNNGGNPDSHGTRPSDYLSDVLMHEAARFIKTADEDRPLFLFLTPRAPHGPATPAPRHRGDFANATIAPGESLNEADVRDKPAYMQDDRFSDKQLVRLAELEQKRLESLSAVDEGVQEIVQALADTGRLANTYLFFASDNGYLMGQHRRVGKHVPYEEAIRIPLIVRGPTISPGTTSPAIVANIDLAPTIAELSGVSIPGFVDGRSIRPSFDGSGSSRRSILIESLGLAGDDNDDLIGAPKPTPLFAAIRTHDLVYVEYVNPAHERELYDLTRDPYQLDNLIGAASPSLRADLAARLAELSDCATAGCRRAEDAPMPNL